MTAVRANQEDYLRNMPIELVFVIAGYLENKDLYCLALGNPWLSGIFNIELKRRFIEGSKTVSLAGDSNNTLFLTKNGNLYACGKNAHGQHGRQNRDAYSQPYRVKSMPSLQGIYTPKSASVFFHTKSGSILTTGNITRRELFADVPSQSGALKTLPLPEGVRKVFRREMDLFFLMRDGSVYSQGHNQELRLGLGHRIGVARIPKKIPSLNQIRKVFPGFKGTFFINAQGRVFACGSNESGNLGLGVQAGPYLPTQIQFEESVAIKSVALGNGSTLFLGGDGRVYACGNNDHGQLGLGHVDAVHTPKRIKTLGNIISVFISGCRAFFVNATGQVFACGSNQDGRLGLAGLQQSSVPVQVEGLEGVTRVKFIDDATLFLQAKGNVFACGVGIRDFPGMTDADEPCNKPIKIPALKSMSCFFDGESADDRDMLVVRRDGTVMAWGNNHDHILGLPAPFYEAPARVVFPEIESYLTACSPSVLMALSRTGNDFYYQFAYGLAVGKLKSTPSIKHLDAAIEERAAFLHYLHQNSLCYAFLSNNMQALFPGLKKLFDKVALLNESGTNNLFYAYALLFTLYNYVKDDNAVYSCERAAVNLFNQLTKSEQASRQGVTFENASRSIGFPQVHQSRRTIVFGHLWGLLDNVLVSDLHQAAMVLKAEIDLPGLDQVKRKPEEELPEDIQPKMKKRR